MRRTKLIAVLVAVLFASVSAISGATAQNSSKKGSKASKELKRLAEEKKSLIDEDIEGMSGQEKLSRGQGKIKDSRESLAETNTLLEDAREQEKDIRKINCINERLAAIKGFLKVSEQSYVKLKKAVSDGDTEEANHHYTLISISNKRVDKLTEEARICTGEVQRYAEGTKVDMKVDDDIADGTDFTTDGAGELMALPELTPFQ
jgi:hypothetical protein